MIIEDDGKITVLMGDGDIRVNGGMVDDPTIALGCVMFSDQDPSPIGVDGEIDLDDCLVENDQVRLVFSKVESIDVVMAQLQTAKDLMLSELAGPGQVE